jgi:hypothetical protein
MCKYSTTWAMPQSLSFSFLVFVCYCLSAFLLFVIFYPCLCLETVIMLNHGICGREYRKRWTNLWSSWVFCTLNTLSQSTVAKPLQLVLIIPSVSQGTK